MLWNVLKAIDMNKYDNKQRLAPSSLEHTAFDKRFSPDGKPVWNSTAKQNSINKTFNPEITNPNEVGLN